LVTGSALAANVTATANLTINATVATTAKLSLDVTTITFPDADPDTVKSIPAIPNPVHVAAKAKTTTNGVVTLTVITNGDLISGSDIIAIGKVTWTKTGAGFVSGTMNKTTPQFAGSWSGSGSRSGTFTYKLANSWKYATGSYTATATYALTSP